MMITVVTQPTKSAVAADPLDTWQWRNPTPQGHNLQSAAFGNGALILGGEGPTLIRSVDGGLNWAVMDHGVAPAAANKKITSIAYGNGIFVAVMEVGSYVLHASILTSPDGVDWTARDLPTAGNTAARVVFANGQFVALASHAQDKFLLTSSNGSDWVRVDYDFNAYLFRDLIHVSGQYIAVGESASNASVGVIVTSPDLQSWTVRRNDVVTPMYRVAHGDGKYVAVGSSGTATSFDGINWSDYVEFTLQESRVAIAYGNGIFISLSYSSVFQDSRLFTSTDGASWTGSSRLPGTFGLAFDGSQFVVPGAGGRIMTTTDGLERSIRSGSVAASAIAHVAYGNDRFVALVPNYGSASVLTSTDGSTWEGNDAYLSTEEGLAFGNGLFVAVGDNGALESSTDGETWTPNTVQDGGALAAVAYLGNQFIAVGDALSESADSPILTSANGLEWTPRTSGTIQALRDATFGNGRYVIVGSGVVLHSTDSVTWTAATPPGGFSAHKVAFGNGVFFALGEFASSYVSADGENWTTVSVAGRILLFDGSRFIIGGSGGEIRSSTDGETWLQHSSATHQRFFDGVRGPSTVVMVGFNGMILESDPLTTAPAAPLMQASLTGTPGEVELLINGDAGSNYEIQYSSELPPAWNTLGQILDAAERETYLDATTSDPMRIYRVRLLP